MTSWLEIIKEEIQKDYFKNIINLVQQDARQFEIYPKHIDIFKAFKHCEFDNTKVVILGQDPYINPNQAHGLSFSVLPGNQPPPSLLNIFKELNSDIGFTIPNHGCLESWAKQGVLLLNSVLTVRKGESGSHKSFGWQIFTDNIIKILNEREIPTVFLLWGSFAKSKKSLITSSKHLILESVHPSPLSAYNGFFGCKHFSKTNDFLIKNNLTPVNWDIEKVNAKASKTT